MEIVLWQILISIVSAVLLYLSAILVGAGFTRGMNLVGLNAIAGKDGAPGFTGPMGMRGEKGKDGVCKCAKKVGKK